MADRECFFKWKFGCQPENTYLSTAGPSRIKSIIKCSKVYGDTIHVQLQERLDTDSTFTIHCHRNCVSTYTSSQQLNRHLKRHGQEPEKPPNEPKYMRRSESPTFRFLEHCIFCGMQCSLEKDPRHPDRWRRAVLCRTANRGSGVKTFKEAILENSYVRNDEWARQVRVRVEGAVSDLHAADGRYHVDCMTKFMKTKSPKCGTESEPQLRHDEVDEAFSSVIADIGENYARIWNSVELFKLYEDKRGTRLTKKQLVKELSDHFGENLLVLSSPGVANIIVFRREAPGLLKLVPDDDTSDLDNSVNILRKEITQEIKEKAINKGLYTIRIDKESATECVSDTLLSFLAKLSSKLDNTLPAILIGNIITSILTNTPTPLQIALGLLLKDSKETINQLHEFGVSCTYDEILRFRKSAAVAATTESSLTGLADMSTGLIQAVADNFDADISSQNGKISTHSLALLLTQPQPESVLKDTVNLTIPRLKKSDMQDPIKYELEVQHYSGPKKPEMPADAAKHAVLPLKTLAHITIAKRRARTHDFGFMKDVTADDKCPEYNGYNTRLCREQRHSLSTGTKAVYMPLIDMSPADPDTMMTALAQAEKLVSQTGQEFTIFTCDQQLYRVSLQVIWAYPEQFSNVVLRLGGMHMLMSFVGAVGTLMAESGLAEILSTAFSGVPKMLSGKKFPQNVRALRLVAEELLRRVIHDNNVSTYDDLQLLLDDAAGKSRTAKLWVDMLIRPVFIMMLYVRAEREGDWPLHLDAVQQMLPYFFVSGHVNYARYGLYYLRSMERLPPEVMDKFMKGEHVMHHIPGVWNGIWSDMYIETTFMRYGHSHGGIIGITLQPETLKTWALGLHIRSRLVEDIACMTDPNCAVAQETHKEEMRSRIKADAADRTAIRKKLELCIDPLAENTETDRIVNIASGRVAPPSVTVDNAFDIGTQQMKDFECSLPAGFYDTISRKVVTMQATRKHVKVGGKKMVNTELLFSRVIGLQASSHETTDIKELLTYELSPVPTSMFTDAGDMRIGKAKAQLKKQLQVDMSNRKAMEEVKCVVLDGSAVLWVIHWPSSGTVRDFVANVKKYISKKMEKTDVYLVFDRYRDFSTKSATRSSREAEASKVHQLNLDTPLPPQKVVLTVSENKKQLMELICTELVDDKIFQRDNMQNHKLVITGSSNTPIEMSYGGVLVNRHDMSTSHEEADCIIVQQAVMAAKDLNVGVSVIADDTDVFVLLAHHYHEQHLTVPMVMESPIHGRTVIDIHDTVQKWQNVVQEILAMHAISGCDTVACCYGIGKVKALKVLQTGYSLSHMGDVHASLADVTAQATAFVTACYGQKDSTSLTEARQKCWMTKVGKGHALTAKLHSLPPTNEAFLENVKRAHLQACVWKHALDPDPPPLDPLEYGYICEDSSKSLLPTTVPDDVSLAPERILKMVCCSCHSDKPCNSMRCGCASGKLPCTIFCACHSEGCYNELTGTDIEGESEDGQIHDT